MHAHVGAHKHTQAYGYMNRSAGALRGQKGQIPRSLRHIQL